MKKVLKKWGLNMKDYFTNNEIDDLLFTSYLIERNTELVDEWGARGNLTKEEAKSIYKALLLNQEIEKKNLKIQKITNKAYMIELIEIPTELKNQIKEDVASVGCTVYKTKDTLEELKRRQENRELVQALQERKAQGEAI